jgi:stage II sporulation protein D (peptidoglycan lytic transglycosylase)
MRRLGLLGPALVLVAGCFTTLSPLLPQSSFALPLYVRVQVVDRGVETVKEIPLETYVQATALSEFAPPAGETVTVERMLEVQAIISRTYAVAHMGRHAREGFDLCSTTHCQLFEPGRINTSRWAPAAAEAVDRTSGVVLSFEGGPADAVFHADCGGYTSAPATVWGGGNLPYLLSRADSGGGLPEGTHVPWEYRASLDAVARAINSDARTHIVGMLIGLDITSRDAAGRAERVTIMSRKTSTTSPMSVLVRGEELRQVLTREFGPRSIRSTMFDVRRDRENFTFSGRGFGHGVGLCQAGALGRLKSGATSADVFKNYYPGTILVRGS